MTDTPMTAEIRFGPADLRRAAVLLRAFVAADGPNLEIYNSIVVEVNELSRHDSLLVALLHLFRDMTVTADRGDLERGLDGVVHRYAAYEHGRPTEGDNDDE